MFTRIITAGVLGGAVVFFAGFIGHMVLGWGGRNFVAPPDEAALRTSLREAKLEPGLYMIPHMKQGFAGEEAEAEWKRVAELAKEGPTAFLVIQPHDEVMELGPYLLREFLTNVAAAFLAAMVISQFGADRSFFTRWFAVLLIGVFAWLSIAASFEIWYRFPHGFIRDELLSALLEWSVAGLVIASIVPGYGGSAVTEKPRSSSSKA